MKVWFVVFEQRDENGDICNYCICGTYDTYNKAKEKQGMYTYKWRRTDRKILYIGKDVAVSVGKNNIRSVIYVEEREVK